jgi:hypothetical protein
MNNLIIGPSLEADGVITIYDIETGSVIAQYEGFDVHETMLQADMWKKERAALLEMTAKLDEHSEGYEGPCLCKLCQSYF